MKIKVTDKAFDEVLAIKKGKHENPVHQSAFFRWVMSTLSKKELKDVNFTYEEERMECVADDEPVLFLMNHSSFTDLQIAAVLLKNREYHIIITNDGIVGKAGLMKKIGCIPTRKFITDTTLVKDMVYAAKELNSSILMYPEASYSFDGTETALPDSMGKCVKLLNVPVVMIRTKGAFLRDPLYNNLQKRKVDVSAKVTCILNKEEIEAKTPAEINEILKEAFSYNHFKEQVESGVCVAEDFRADGLERVLYKCVGCGAEGKMRGKGTKIVCEECGDTHELLPSGLLKRHSGETIHQLVTDWYKWERECVKRELEEGKYLLDVAADILMLVDSKSMYRVGEGRLIHNSEGFKLTGLGGKLDFVQKAKSMYSLYADYFWYEIGDMIAIGDSRAQYYCFPKTSVPVAKARLATEELYKMKR